MRPCATTPLLVGSNIGAFDSVRQIFKESDTYIGGCHVDSKLKYRICDPHSLFEDLWRARIALYVTSDSEAWRTVGETKCGDHINHPRKRFPISEQNRKTAVTNRAAGFLQHLYIWVQKTDARLDSPIGTVLVAILPRAIMWPATATIAGHWQTILPVIINRRLATAFPWFWWNSHKYNRLNWIQNLWMTPSSNLILYN